MLSVILILFAGNIGGQTHEYMTPSAHGLCCTCDFRNVLYVLRHAMLGVAANHCARCRRLYHCVQKAGHMNT